MNYFPSRTIKRDRRIIWKSDSDCEEFVTKKYSRYIERFIVMSGLRCNPTDNREKYLYKLPSLLLCTKFNLEVMCTCYETLRTLSSRCISVILQRYFTRHTWSAPYIVRHKTRSLLPSRSFIRAAALSFQCPHPSSVSVTMLRLYQPTTTSLYVS